MRIAMFSDNFYPEMSGISDSIIDSSKELAKLGHQVDIYAPRYSKKDFATFNVKSQEIDLGENIKVHRFFAFWYPTPTKQGRMVIPTFLRWLFMLKNKPDIMHVHDIFGVGIEGMAASKILGVPLVGTNHTPITEFLKYGPVQNRFVDKLGLGFVSWFYNRCDFVSAPCNAILEEMRAHGFKRPSRALSNPVDLKNFYPAGSEQERVGIKKEFGLSDFTVLYTGRLAVEKHIDVLIRAVAQLKDKIPNINFAITGHGAAEGSLKKLAEELGVSEKVKFFGTLSVEKHARIYKAAEMFAIASTAETQSLSMMKAMASKVPVIGVNAWALPEYINNNNGFVVEPGDFEGMAEKILFVYENPEQRERLGKGGMESAGEFSPAKIAMEWDNIYKETALAHKSGRQKAYEA